MDRQASFRARIKDAVLYIVFGLLGAAFITGLMLLYPQGGD